MGSVPNIDLDKKAGKTRKKITMLLYPILAILAVVGANYLFDYVVVKKKLFVNPMAKIQSYYKEKNYLKVIEIGEEVIKKTGSSMPVRRYLWKSYLYTNQFGNAVTQLQEMEKLSRENIEVDIGFCNLYRYMEQYEKAIFFCEKALDKEPGSEQAHDLIIQIMLEEKKYDEATRYLDSTYGSSTNVLKTSILRAAIASSQNDFKKSIEILESVRKNYPNIPLIFYTLGMNYFETGDYSKAVSYLEEFTGQTGADDMAADNLDSAFEILGTCYEKSSMYSNAGLSYKKAACLGMKKGHTDFAVRMVRKAVNTTYEGYSGFVSGREFDKRFKLVVKDLESQCNAKLFLQEQEGEN